MNLYIYPLLEGKMKRSLMIFLVAIFIVPLVFGGCSKKNNSEDIIYSLKDMDSYTCDVNIDFKNDRQVISTNGKQYYDKNIGYRFDLGSDRIFTYKNNSIYVNDIKNGCKYTTDMDFDSVYKLTFINEYIGLLYTNEQIKTDIKTKDNIQYLAISLVIPGGNRNMNNAELLVDMNTNLPEYLTIFDEKHNEKLSVQYSNFKADVKISSDIFRTQ